jgi:H+-transporting ATPase
VTNAIIGFLHSRNSQRALEPLRERLAVNAVVRRGGTWVTTNASEIVPGDVAVVQMGDIIPADAKVLHGSLSVDQSALTGESLPYAGFEVNNVLATAALTAKPESKDGIDMAVRERAEATGITNEDCRQISVTPFEPATKRSEAVIQAGTKRFRAVKGAPQVVLSLSRLTDNAVVKAAGEMVEALSRKGSRTLAVARSRSEEEQDLELVGLLALADPPRPDAKQMIAEARNLGVKPIMVTGDNIAIARQMAFELGIGENVMRMGELTASSEAQQMLIVQGCDVLAEVYPEDKYKIVKLLQAHGHTSGMTGDGVNDAPALKQAEVGIAVKGATNVAKASASMVLTEPGIRVIVDALKSSRQIYQRMLTWVINKVTKTIQLVGLLTLGFFWLHDLVVSLLGMALLVFANDFVTMTLSTDNVKYTRNPNNWNVRNVTLASAGIGVFFILEGWLTILIGRNLFHLSGEGLRGFVLLMLVFTSQFRIYIVRERRHFWDSRPGRGILISSAAAIVVFSLLGIFGGIIQGLGVFPVLFLVAFSGFFTLAVELPKYHIFRRLGL